jgi:hypothetical protein
MSYGLPPMVINDSSLGLSSKVADAGRERVLSLAQGAVCDVVIVLFVLARLWAAFAGGVIWMWSRSSQKD